VDERDHGASGQFRLTEPVLENASPPTRFEPPSAPEPRRPPRSVPRVRIVDRQQLAVSPARPRNNPNPIPKPAAAQRQERSMPEALATKTTPPRRATANEKRTSKQLTLGPTHSRHGARSPADLLGAGGIHAYSVSSTTQVSGAAGGARSVHEALRYGNGASSLALPFRQVAWGRVSAAGGH